MTTRRKYTIEEEQIIAEEVSNHQTNIKQGLTIAAERIGRSYSAVNNHWYAVQSKREVCFLVGSATNSAINRKVIRTSTWDSKRESSCGLFKRILRWLGL